MVNRKFSYSILVVVTLLFLASCRSQKLSIVDNEGKINVRSQNSVFEDIIDKEYSYNTISTKGKVSLMNKEVTAFFKIEKNKILQASVRPLLGIEVLRLDITPSQIVIIDRLKKQYATVSLGKETISSLGFNYYNLQSILTNRLFIAGTEDISSKDWSKFNYRILNNEYLLDFTDKHEINYIFSIDNQDNINRLAIAIPEKDASMIWEYKDFVTDNKNKTYPTKINARVK